MICIRAIPLALLTLVGTLGGCRATAADHGVRTEAASAKRANTAGGDCTDAAQSAAAEHRPCAEAPRLVQGRVAEKPEITIGNGDLWPSCWSDDDQLYAAWGDGKGFGDTFAEIGVARISGHPRAGTLRGENLATNESVGPLWGPGANRQYHRKPTGMVCVGSELYLAVQDLSADFNEVPAATIVKSSDRGRTWQWDPAQPMFSNHELTTIFFLDRGKASADRSYVYAYALDRNWRDSFTDIVADPVDMYLARVPPDALQDRSRWEWFTGLNAQREPTWSARASERQPVLSDPRRIYPEPRLEPAAFPNQNAQNLSVISQGSVVYVAPLKRYVYTSWTEFTYEFYEAEQPWGPFRLFFRHDFGRYPWSADKAGGYATTIPSKFIADDGSMYLQSNTFVGGVELYGFSLRPLWLSLSGAR